MLSASPTAIFYTLVGRIGAEFQFAYSYRAISGEFVYIERDQHETLALEESAWCKDNERPCDMRFVRRIQAAKVF